MKTTQLTWPGRWLLVQRPKQATNWLDLSMTCSFWALLIKHRYSKVACIAFVIQLTTQVCFFFFL